MMVIYIVLLPSMSRSDLHCAYWNKIIKLKIKYSNIELVVSQTETYHKALLKWQQPWKVNKRVQLSQDWASPLNIG